MRIYKFIFLRYSSNSKSYRLYDEENKKFILSQDVSFLEYSKYASTIDTQLSHFDKLISKKFYCESDNGLPHPKGGIPIL